MTLRSVPTETTADATVKALKPKRKRPAVRKKARGAAKPAAARIDLRHRDAAPVVVLLPVQACVPLLTYAGDSHQAIAAASDPPDTINLPYTPLPAAPYDPSVLRGSLAPIADRSRRLDLHAAAVAASGAATWAAASAQDVAQSLLRRLVLFVERVNHIDLNTAIATALGGAASAAAPILGRAGSLRTRLFPPTAPLGSQVTARPQGFMALSQDWALSRVPRARPFDPRVVMMIALAGATFAAALLYAHASPMKSDGAIIRFDPLPTEKALAQDMRPRPRPHLSFSKIARVKHIPHAIADVRIIDAPARMQRSCREQTWPYIAAHCLTMAKSEVAPAAVNPVGAAATPALPAVQAADSTDSQDAQSVENPVVKTDTDRIVPSQNDSPASADKEKSDRVHHASERRHREEHRHYAHTRQSREGRVADGPKSATAETTFPFASSY